MKCITFGRNIPTDRIFQIISILNLIPDIKKIKIKKMRKGRQKLVAKMLNCDELLDLYKKFNDVVSVDFN